MENILITGGLGYIGSHVVWALHDAGYSPVIVDDLSTGFYGNIPPHCKVEIGDLGHKIWLDALLKRYRIDTVIHLAAKTSAEESIKKPLFYYQQNTINTFSLLRSIVESNVKTLLFSSTAAVYANKEFGLIEEDSPLNPCNPYGQSKLAAEKMITAAAKTHAFNAIIFRYFNVAGADANGMTGNTQPNPSTLIKRVVNNVLAGYPEITIFGEDYPTPDGTCLRDYVHVSDVAAAHLDLITYLSDNNFKRYCNSFNIGYGKAFSVNEIIDAAELLIGQSISRYSMPRRIGDIVRSVSDPSRIKALVNWQPQYDHNLLGIIETELAWAKRFTKPILTENELGKQSTLW